MLESTVLAIAQDVLMSSTLYSRYARRGCCMEDTHSA